MNKFKVDDLVIKIGLISGNKYIAKILECQHEYGKINQPSAKIQILQIICEPSILFRYSVGNIFSFPVTVPDRVRAS